MKPSYFLCGLLIILASCNSQPRTSNNTSSPANPETTSQALNAKVSADSMISEKGIGKAQIGMTFGELKQKLGSKAEFELISSFMSDLDAIAVKENGEVQFYILYFIGQKFTDSNQIQILLTENPKFRTKDGVGAQTSIKQAQSIYGQASLSYNTEYESREYVKFAKTPGWKITFRTNGNFGDSGFMGIYPDSEGGAYYETNEFKDNALIGSVMVEGSLH